MGVLLTQTIKKVGWVREWVVKVNRIRSAWMLREVKRSLDLGDKKVLDVGTGLGGVAYLLNKAGSKVTSVDINNVCLEKGVKVNIYDGKTLKFPDKSFDAGLLLFVLHHTPNPETVLKEVTRVSKRVVIMEDVFSNWLSKYWTFFIDSLGNLEFSGHPHTNKRDEVWRNLFRRLGYKLKEVRIFSEHLGVKRILYCLDS